MSVGARNLIWLVLLPLPLYAGDAQTIALGRRLFFNRNLSRDGQLSCAGCHDPQRAFSDGRPVVGARRAPTLVNRDRGRSFFWDGRAATLEQQVIQPIFDPTEMGMTRESVEALIRSEPYRTLFNGAPTLDRFAVALASYIRTITSGDSPYDRFERGEKTALTRAEIRGLFLFRREAGCSACHNGPNLTDEDFHNTGIASRAGARADPGRAGVTGDAKDRGAFKTPTLREVARRGPYMHDGSLSTLEQVVDYYDRGGEGAGLDPHMRPLHLTAGEKQDIVAYLGALNGSIREGK
jgi:cytochrome c peroxidase